MEICPGTATPGDTNTAVVLMLIGPEEENNKNSTFNQNLRFDGFWYFLLRSRISTRGSSRILNRKLNFSVSGLEDLVMFPVKPS